MKKLSKIIILPMIIVLFSSTLNNFVINVDAENILDVTDNLVTQIKDYKSNEIIITYKDSIDIHTTDQILESVNEKDLTQLSDRSVMLAIESKSILSETIDKLEQDNNISSIQPNYIYRTNALIDEPYYSLQWAFENNGTFVDQYNTASVNDIDMNIADIPPNSSFKKDVIVAVIDTGIANTHEDLKDAMWTNINETPGDGIDNDGNGYIDDLFGWNFYSNSNVLYNKRTLDDHGTHVAGIIAATQNKYGVAGIASFTNVKIMPIQALGGNEGSGSTESIMKAIQYAEQMGASICNISAGTDNNDVALKETIKNSKMLFVIAAGNGDDDNKGLNNDYNPLYPASYNIENIISVANLTCAGFLHSSSNYGLTSVDIAAPGTSIWSTLAGNRYGYLTGTSMAAPMVTGVAALVYSYYDNITLSQTKAIILDSAKELPSLKYKVSTGGMPNAYAALSYTEDELLKFDTVSPSITTKEKYIANSYYKTLNITINDNFDSLSTIRYVKGKKEKSYFKTGGTNLSLKNNIGSIKVSTSTTYTIYAKDTAGNETIKVVKVSIIKPTKLYSVSKKTMKVGSSFYVKLKLSPANVHTGLTFRSSNKKVATIGLTKGKITAYSKGTTTITITTQNGLSTKFVLTVTK